MSKRCFLGHVSPCNGGMSREHFISRNVLEQIGGVSVDIGGLSWQPKNELQSIGVSALTAKVLCEKHNSSLSDLDSEFGRFFQTVHLIDKQATDVPDDSAFDGQIIERWLLKLAAGLVHGPMQEGHSISQEKLEILVTNKWPDCWGLYVQIPQEITIHAKGLEIELRSHPETGEILAIWAYVAGISLQLILGAPDNPSAFGLYRPRGLIFQGLPGEKRIEFNWPFPHEQAVIYRRIGSTESEPQHWGEWNS